MASGHPAPLNPERQFARFAGIGGLGFLIDAGVLTLLVATTSMGPYWARLLSFATAVSVTWYANRRWVFEPETDASAEYVRYVLVQVAGAGINVAIYVLLIMALPELAHWPVVPLAGGAAVALLFNFFSARRLVFRRSGEVAPGAPAQKAYSGRQNLEAMEEARNYNNYLLNLVLRHSSPGRVLDFGAGTGTFAKRMVTAGFDLLCVEPSPDLRSELEANGFTVVADVADVPTGSVDFVYTLNVLEHIERDEEALLECGRCLRPGGKLLIYVPAFQVLYSSMDRNVGHFRRYRRGDLVHKLEAAGFVVASVRYVDSLGFIASLVYKWLGDSSGSIDPRSVAIYDSVVFPASVVADRVLGGLFGKNLVAVATHPRP